MTPAGHLCRDCLNVAPDGDKRCPNCGSPRRLDLGRASGLQIAHVDCDAFYASVEKRDDPSLKDKPLIVGGGGRRGVVSTACYIARTRGVRSAMPTATALKLCPEAVLLAPDMTKYAAVAKDIRALMFALTPLVEPLSIDEAFLDLTGCEATHRASAAEILAGFAREVETRIGVTISVGLSYCKFLAKLASDLDKPRGFAFIRQDEAIERLGPMPVGRLWGVGKVAEARLEKLGLRTIGDVQRLTEIEAAALFGDARLWRLAQGLDDRKVSLDREAKSLSVETTFETDMGDREKLERTLLRLCEKLARRLKAAGLAAGGVTLKLRTPDFKLRTRTRSGLPPTQMAMRLFAAARQLLRREPDGARYRLIGIGAADLKPGDEADAFDLAEGDRSREKAREQAIDALRAKFGAGAVQRGLAFDPDGRKPR